LMRMDMGPRRGYAPDFVPSILAWRPSGYLRPLVRMCDVRPAGCHRKPPMMPTGKALGALVGGDHADAHRGAGLAGRGHVLPGGQLSAGSDGVVHPLFGESPGASSTRASGTGSSSRNRVPFGALDTPGIHQTRCFNDSTNWRMWPAKIAWMRVKIACAVASL